MNMSEGGLAHNLRLAGLLDIAIPRQPLQVMDDTRSAIVAERERGDKIIDIARRHGVSVSQVVKFCGTRRKYRESVVGQLRDEVHRAALEMTPKELAELFNLPKGTAYYHHSKARYDAQTNAAEAS
jgi:transposase-like protein